MHRISLILAVNAAAIGFAPDSDAIVAFNGMSLNGIEASGLSTDRQLNGLRFSAAKVVEPQGASAQVDAPLERVVDLLGDLNQD